MTASVARFIESFIPENYNLFLDINRSEKTFTGNVAITVEALDNHISLHQKDLTISSVLLDNESLNFQMDDANESSWIKRKTMEYNLKTINALYSFPAYMMDGRAEEALTLCKQKLVKHIPTSNSSRREEG